VPLATLLGRPAQPPPSPALGRALLRLLQFYGEDFNPATTGLLVHGGGAFELPAEPRDLQAWLRSLPHNSCAGLLHPHLAVLDPLVLPDPLDADANVGRNCFRFFQVQAAFRAARAKLMAAAASHPLSAPPLAASRQGPPEPAAAAAGGGEAGAGGGGARLHFPMLSLILPSLAAL